MPLLPSPGGLTAAGLMRRSASSAAPAPRPGRAIRRALTAAATIAGRSVAKQTGKGGGGWQRRAWDAYDEVGEAHYAAEFFGNCVARVRLTVEERQDDGTWAEVEGDRGPAVEALRRLESETGAMVELQRCYGEQQFVAGESFLFGRGVERREVWSMVSGEELEIRGGKIKHRPGGGLPEREYADKSAEGGTLGDGDAVAYRLWNGHPRRSGEADSPLRPVLPICEELVLLGRAVRGRARNRASGPGVLFVHDSITEDERLDPGMDEDVEQEDPFVADMIETMSTARGDEESAAAAVPIVIRLNPPDGVSIRDSVHLLALTDPSVAYPESERETHSIRRLAQGLNLPVEVVLGMATANHWSGWLIDDSIWTQHLQSPVERLCGDLTRILIDGAEGLEPGRFRIWRDVSDLVVNPDRFGDALQAHDRLAISDEALRTAGGFTDDDAPDEDEIARRRPAAAGPPPAGPGTTDEGPPGEAAVAAAAVWRCREYAGARLLTRLQREPAALLADARSVDKTSVAAHLGRERVEGLGVTAPELVRGGADFLRAAGYDRRMIERIERQAAAGLFGGSA